MARSQIEEAGHDLAGDARYRMLFESSPLPMWVYDAETLAFLAVNDAAVRRYGWSRDEFLTMSITEIRPRSEVERLLADIRSRRRRLPRSRRLAPPAARRHRDRRRDQRRPDRLRGPRRRARRRPRRHRSPPDRGADRRVREARGDRAPGGRRRARLQQPAHRDRGLRGGARGGGRRARVARARSAARPTRRRRSPASCWRSAAARCSTREPLDVNEVVSSHASRCSQRIIGDDVQVGHEPRARGRRGRGRPRADRADRAQPGRQRARRDAARRPADDRDGARRPRRRLRGDARRRRARPARDARDLATPAPG